GGPPANGSTSAAKGAGSSPGSGNACRAGTAASSAKPPGSLPNPRNRTDAQWATSPLVHHSQRPHDATGRTATVAPARQPAARALAPTATTSPPSSCPMTVPGGLTGPALVSEPHTPHAVTRTPS